MVPITKKLRLPQRLLFLGALLVVSCESEYQLAPTFCDDWCRATQAADCARPPARCVSDCELTRSSDDCFALQEELLSCYESAPESLICVDRGPGGFGDETRVSDGQCQAERDALFDCEAPGIAGCLVLCRSAQEQQLNELPASSVAPASSEQGRDAGAAADSCPALDTPCEQICWSLFAFSSEGTSAAGLPSDPSSGGSGDIATCVQAALVGCFSVPGAPVADSGTPLGTTTNSHGDGSGSEAGESQASIGRIVEDCIEGLRAER